MAIILEKGQRINLEKKNGSRLSEFCVGCNWGAIRRSGFFGFGGSSHDVDLDLSCVMTDKQGNLVDHIYSPLYRVDFLAKYGMPPGKTDSKEFALHHSGDDLKGDLNGNDELDNEIITVNLNKVSSEVDQIFFFLNNVGREDFSQIPYASIRMYEGTPSRVKEVFASYDVAAEPQYAGKTALLLGKLYRRNGEWKFSAIGDAFPDKNLCETIARIVNNYAK
ncbi:MAG: tellurium resistance TerZ family protein [Muribaculaceae bacterium]|nr:tellurium resistance TerZ family protein [Muribaculaceae bacterium]